MLYAGLQETGLLPCTPGQRESEWFRLTFHLATLVGFAVPILGAAVAHGATPNRHNLTLVLGGTGEEATLRLLPEHVPAHVSLDPLTPVPGAISERDDKQLSRRWSVWCDPTHRNAASSNDCRILAQSIQNSAIVVNKDSTRHISYSSCYFSWSGNFDGYIGDLWYAGIDVINACSFRSGSNPDDIFVTGAGLDYVAVGVDQCISNRASPC